MNTDALGPIVLAWVKRSRAIESHMRIRARVVRGMTDEPSALVILGSAMYQWRGIIHRCAQMAARPASLGRHASSVATIEGAHPSLCANVALFHAAFQSPTLLETRTAQIASHYLARLDPAETHRFHVLAAAASEVAFFA